MKKVLLVDDDFALGGILSEALKEAGYAVHYQTSLNALVDVLLEFKPDVAVLDVELEGGNGIEKLPEIRKAMPDLPVIFISSHHEGAFEVRALSGGGEAYLRKPFEVEVLLTYVKKYSKGLQPVSLSFGNWELEVETRKLLNEGHLVKVLTSFENRLLSELVCHVGELVPRTRLERALWGEDVVPNSAQSVNNYVVRLRRLLESDASVKLRGIRGAGYGLFVR